jgi:hypothetical protein
LLEYVIGCLDEAGLEADRSRTSLGQLAEDISGQPSKERLGARVPVIDGCISQGLAELYPDLPPGIYLESEY